MLVVFIHGWSVTNTDTYGDLPRSLAAAATPDLNIAIAHLHLAKYVSFADPVTVDDLARGMQHAIETEVRSQLGTGEKFACITHSTGGPVARTWVNQFYHEHLNQCPMSHLIMLAPANHGSALAQLGKGSLARMKFFAEGVEPGVGVLNWLELGSEEGWKLNLDWLNLTPITTGLFQFVLTGQYIDRNFYDNLNSYTGEAGSDGVVRVAAANMNYGLVRLRQDGQTLAVAEFRNAEKSAFGILPKAAHSGEKHGIMRSVGVAGAQTPPTVPWILRCLAVNSPMSYQACLADLAELTDATQSAERKESVKGPLLIRRQFKTSRYCMLVFRVLDDRGQMLTDYDILLTAGPDYDPNHLPPNFFVDRQRNRLHPGRLTYYVDCDVMSEWMQRPQLQDRFGIRVAVRPDQGFAHYEPASLEATFSAFADYFEPNQTLMIEVVMHRYVGQGVFRLTDVLTPEDFREQPIGPEIP